MRANEFINHRIMAKIESTGKIVQILRHADQVQFSDKPGWFLINTEPDRRMGNIKWIPDSTRFTWVKNFESLKERQQTQFQGLDLSLTVEKDDEYVDDDDTENQTVSITASSGGRELGHVLFTIDYDSEGMILLPQDLEVDERYRGQGIARVMYDYAKSQGYRIRRSGQQTDAGRGFWQKHRPNQNIWEVNFPDELSVSNQIQQYFFKRGYKLAGEGRDQMAFESPRGTIVKVLGTGDPERENIVRNYVTFFERNQRNPFYPRIYSSGEFTVDGETYFVYEMERVNYVANEEATLDYIEKLMSAVDREQGEQFLQRNPVPAEMSEEEIYGLIQATEDMIQAIGGMAPLDLSAVENLGRRDNGHLVIVDPYSL